MEYTIHAVINGRDNIIARHVKQNDVQDMIEINSYRGIVYAMPERINHGNDTRGNKK